ncbi:hypothetical protein FAM23852_001680 [Propionibacterium freudenreichii]|uniref:ParB family protein n=1 Tax=Propionibacterium freudenreichii TaxID=1744 RepID=UPI00254A63DC|nr:hypothetical protein [Propionibacterium freudenreichii]MDK9322184.1 hypothetical protein [Propionibacterium freudenreichii]
MHPLADGLRARAAWERTHLDEGTRTFSEFINGAIMREVRRLEAEYHHGKPFTGGDRLPGGRKAGD